MFLSRLVATDDLDPVSKFNSIDYADYQCLRQKYNLINNDSKQTVKHKLWKYFSNSLFIDNV